MAEQLVKIVVFVPLSHADQVREAMANAGAGNFGNYSHCSFSSIGHGRFKPNDQASPFIGEAGVLEVVEEERIEVVCPLSLAKTVIAAIAKVHPYEEMALDVYPLLALEDLP